jgi:hypothetical protein
MFVGINVSDSGICSKYFSTLYKIPTDDVRLEIHMWWYTVHDKLCLYYLFILLQTLKLQTEYLHEQQMTRMGWISLYTTQDARSLI